jgi:hypothetical protein
MDGVTPHSNTSVVTYMDDDNTIQENYEDIGPETFVIPPVVTGVNGIPACDVPIDGEELFYYLDSIRPSTIAYYTSDRVIIGEEVSNGVYKVYAYKLERNKLLLSQSTQDISTITTNYIHSSGTLDASTALEIYKSRTICAQQSQYAANITLATFERNVVTNTKPIEKIILLAGTLAVPPDKLFVTKPSKRMIEALISSTRELLSLPDLPIHEEFGLEANEGLLANNIT